MADVPQVGAYPEHDDEYDDRVLDIILTDYAKEEIPRLGITPFRNTYLPLLAKRHPRDIDTSAVRQMWIAEVAKSNRYPVFITEDGDSEAILYRVPPLIGAVHTGVTGHEESMNSLDQMEREYKDRLSTMGKKVRAMKFGMFSPTSGMNRQYQLDWIKILLDFGYLTELKEVLGDGPYPEDVAAVVGDKLVKVDLSVPSALQKTSASGPAAGPVIGPASDEVYEDEDF